MKLRYDRVAVLAAPWLLAASLPAAASGIDQWGVESCAGGVRANIYASCADANSAPIGGPALTYTAYSDTGARVAGGNGLAAAYVGNYSAPGLGITSRAGPNLLSPTGASGDESESPPNDAMDNNGNSEMMLLTFSSAVALNQVALGYGGGDSDLTVLAYTGATNFSFSGKSYGGATGLVANGWMLIGNYANVPFNTQTNINTINPVSSNYWLIGAYNTLGGSPASGFTTGDDYVKLLSVYGTPAGAGVQGPVVPEPSSLLLMGIALFSLTMLRRRGMI